MRYKNQYFPDRFLSSLFTNVVVKWNVTSTIHRVRTRIVEAKEERMYIGSVANDDRLQSRFGQTDARAHTIECLAKPVF